MDDSNNSKKSLKSQMVKGGRITYFFDVYLAKNGKKYLKISETQFMGEGKDRQRNQILVFSEALDGFKSATEQMCSFAKAN